METSAKPHASVVRTAPLNEVKGRCANAGQPCTATGRFGRTKQAVAGASITATSTGLGTAKYAELEKRNARLVLITVWVAAFAYGGRRELDDSPFKRQAAGNRRAMSVPPLTKSAGPLATLAVSVVGSASVLLTAIAETVVPTG